MSSNVSISKIGHPAISISVEISALSPEQQRDLIFECLRSTGLAYVPALEQAIEAVSEHLNFYVSPTKSPVPQIDPFLRLTREEKRTIVVGLLDASTRKDDKYIRLSSRLNMELRGNREDGPGFEPATDVDGVAGTASSRKARPAFSPRLGAELTDADLGKRARVLKANKKPFIGRIRKAPPQTVYAYQLLGPDEVSWVGILPETEVTFVV